MKVPQRKSAFIVLGSLVLGLSVGGGVVAFADEPAPEAASSTSSALSALSALKADDLLASMQMQDGRKYSEATPSWPKNEYGLTVGIPTGADQIARNLPVLTPRTTDDGKAGYILAKDFYLPDPKNGEEAAAQTRKLEDADGRVIFDVYAADGKTLIGTKVVAETSGDDLE